MSKVKIIQGEGIGMRTVTISHFREVKAMLKGGWDDSLIHDRTDWSLHTIQRIRNCKTYQQYRMRVYNEVSTIRERRLVERGPQFIKTPVSKVISIPTKSVFERVSKVIGGFHHAKRNTRG